MCPSYMATREEEHATRGRANALVKALSSPDPRAAMGDERLHEILDLCLECKACKAECPLSVDMATMKSEFLAHYQDEPGRLCARGCSAPSGRSTASAPPPRRSRTCPGGSTPARALLERVAGIDRHRPLPRFARETLLRWDRKRAPVGGGGINGARGDVVFLANSFTTFAEPAIGRAAIELLEPAGWNVRLRARAAAGARASPRGCWTGARDGLLDGGPARARGRRGVPIVGCEP